MLDLSFLCFLSLLLIHYCSFMCYFYHNSCFCSDNFYSYYHNYHYIYNPYHCYFLNTNICIIKNIHHCFLSLPDAVDAHTFHARPLSKTHRDVFPDYSYKCECSDQYLFHTNNISHNRNFNLGHTRHLPPWAIFTRLNAHTFHAIPPTRPHSHTLHAWCGSTFTWLMRHQSFVPHREIESINTKVWLPCHFLLLYSFTQVHSIFFNLYVMFPITTFCILLSTFFLLMNLSIFYLSFFSSLPIFLCALKC